MLDQHKLLDEHSVIELSQNGKEVVGKLIRTDKCKSHYKIEDSYSKRCNVCLCDTCYINHLKDSGNCPSLPMSVKEEALHKKNPKSPNSLKKFAISKKIRRKEISNREFTLRN